jgi:hypothetical protein
MSVCGTRLTKQSLIGPLGSAWRTFLGTNRKLLYNNLITGLKADGLWTKLDLLYIFAAHNSADSLKNVKNPTASQCLLRLWRTEVPDVLAQFAHAPNRNYPRKIF